MMTVPIRMTRVLTAFAILLSFSCGEDDPASEGTAAISAAVSVQPQKYFLQRIAGESMEVFVVVPPGASPAAYEPSPSDMRTMNDIDVWFTVGVPFEEAWIPRFQGSNPQMQVVSTYDNIQRLPIDRYSVETALAHDHQDHSEEEHSHDHGSPDPHVWLSPELVKSQASVMANTLASMDSSGADMYLRNLSSFEEEILQLQDSIHSMLDTLDTISFMVFHPAWGYFADEFGLVQVPVESGGNEPSPREMSLLVDYARDNGIGAIFVSPQFSTSSAEAIAEETGARVLTMDPLAENWSRNLLQAAAQLAEAASRQ
ncbi:MAG: cation ABC transporter substrate-binding protein [Candidatus Aegiribacteria sp.]|nr:cation ABC transporter substrate-binding protein [Candidatus Aegiribacteria sp.]MBD3295220.1 cation ABC transporter substrate-binding protein [Candidatus Fermentibacteria bacterium]